MLHTHPPIPGVYILERGRTRTTSARPRAMASEAIGCPSSSTSIADRPVGRPWPLPQLSEPASPHSASWLWR